jgi:uroporphyrinogen-III synthase
MITSLQNKKILITREQKQAKVLAEKVVRHGGEPIEVPLLEIICNDRSEDRFILKSLAAYRWIFFTSANGVDCFFQLLYKHHIEPALLKHISIAVVGHKTEYALKDHGFSADFIPTVYNAEHMVSEFLTHFTVEGSFLLVRGNRSRNVLPEKFSQIGIDFSTIEVYKTRFNYKMTDRLNEVLKTRQYDFITFTSPSTVEAFTEMAKSPYERVCVCIGTTTETRARELGFTTILTPKEYTIDGMVSIIGNYLARKG